MHDFIDSLPFDVQLMIWSWYILRLRLRRFHRTLRTQLIRCDKLYKGIDSGGIQYLNYLWDPRSPRTYHFVQFYDRDNFGDQPSGVFRMRQYYKRISGRGLDPDSMYFDHPRAIDFYDGDSD